MATFPGTLVPARTTFGKDDAGISRKWQTAVGSLENSAVTHGLRRRSRKPEASRQCEFAQLRADRTAAPELFVDKSAATPTRSENQAADTRRLFVGRAENASTLRLHLALDELTGPTAYNRAWRATGLHWRAMAHCGALMTRRERPNSRRFSHELAGTECASGDSNGRASASNCHMSRAETNQT